MGDRSVLLESNTAGPVASFTARPAPGQAKKKPRSHDRGFVLRIVITAAYRRAGDRTRTGDVQLGKLAFYQLNYARKPTVESHRSGLNRRPLDYESSALPLSYAGVLQFSARRFAPVEFSAAFGG